MTTEAEVQRLAEIRDLALAAAAAGIPLSLSTSDADVLGRGLTEAFVVMEGQNNEAPQGDPVAFPILRFFAFDHLPTFLQDVSRPFADAAHRMATTLPPGPEVSAGLRKLLEAKDCAVRAAIP